ncbi:ParA family protein [Bifidobacterium crudilactis]|uniref:ParA family protein n=1 Tax=Bifidobacterium crudilactis TaxID=327277 RepID=UPI00068CF119|nr:ParA family protein [Bifidobacterium crudilactis]
MAHFITFANTKGGAAKTTSALMFAGILTARGEKVEVRDTDPSGGATDWKKMAQKNGTPLPFLVHSANMKEVDEPPVSDADWVLIDTPPVRKPRSFKRQSRRLILSSSPHSQANWT